MRILKIALLFLFVSSPLLARSAGGGGGHGGHGGRSYSGSRGYRDHGHWNNHSDHYHDGGWRDYNYRGKNHYSWQGPYYYYPQGWWFGGAFLVGYTFYTCNNNRIANTNTWQIYSDDVAEYKQWPSYDSIQIIEVEDDQDWPYRLCNGTSCVKARISRAQ